jgi:hypothetical protein
MNFPVELDDWIENPKAREDRNVASTMYGLQPFYPLPAVRMNAMPELRSENSRRRSEGAPRFEHEGAFRSWLARVLIDEAVTILYKQSSTTRGSGDHDRQSSWKPTKSATRPLP